MTAAPARVLAYSNGGGASCRMPSTQPHPSSRKLTPAQRAAAARRRRRALADTTPVDQHGVAGLLGITYQHVRRLTSGYFRWAQAADAAEAAGQDIPVRDPRRALPEPTTPIHKPGSGLVYGWPTHVIISDGIAAGRLDPLTLEHIALHRVGAQPGGSLSPTAPRVAEVTSRRVEVIRLYLDTPDDLPRAQRLHRVLTRYNADRPAGEQLTYSTAYRDLTRAVETGLLDDVARGRYSPPDDRRT